MGREDREVLLLARFGPPAQQAILASLVPPEELGEFVEILPPQKRVSEHWYQGTADAVYQNSHLIKRPNPKAVAVFGAEMFSTTSMPAFLASSTAIAEPCWP